MDWSWKPDKQTLVALKSGVRKRKKKKRKLGKRQKRRFRKQQQQKLLTAKGHKFYRSKIWLRLRRRVIEEYGYRCMSCGVVDAELHVDHIKPRSLRPDLSLTFDNLQILCRSCNMDKSNYHDTDYREKAAAEQLDIVALHEMRGKI